MYVSAGSASGPAIQFVKILLTCIAIQFLLVGSLFVLFSFLHHI